MFGYNPYGGYSSNPYAYARYTPEQEYLRALADERAAREQYLAARRAQEEARERAARVRLARQAYAPHNSYHFDDDYDTYEDHDAYDGGYGAAPAARQRRAMEELRRRDQLERERERMRLEEERRKLEDEKRRVDEERVRRLLSEEQRRREEEDLRRRRASQFDPFLRSFGWMPEEDELGTRMGRTPLRAQTIAPNNRRQVPSKSPRMQQYPQTHLSAPFGASRSSSMPARGVAQPPSPEQHDAARKIQEVYRAHAARAQALRTITGLRERLDRLRADFRFPAALDFVLPGGGHVSVPADASVLERAAHRAEEATLNVHESLEPARPELAYTSANAPLHGYLEELSRLLSALDAVESHGEAEIREKRKALAREVEGEAERVERCVKAAWGTWHETSQSASAVPENQVHEQEVASQPAPESQSQQVAVAEQQDKPEQSDVSQSQVAHADTQSTSHAEGERMEVEPSPSPTPESNGGGPGPAEDAYMDVPVTVTVDAPQPQDVKDPPAAAQPVEAQAQDDNTRMDEDPDDQEQEPEMTIEVIEAEPEEQEGEKIEVDAQEDASEESMQVESTEPAATTLEDQVAEPESPPTPEVNIEDVLPLERVAEPSDAVPTPTIEEAPSTPEVEITDEPEDAETQAEESIAEPMLAANVPLPAEEVYSAPTPEIDIQDESNDAASIADDKPTQNSGPEDDGTHEPERHIESAPPTPPQSDGVHLHPALSGFVDTVYATSPPPASLHAAQAPDPSTRGSPKNGVSEPNAIEEPEGEERREDTMTPTLSPTKFDGDSDGEVDGPGTPPFEAHGVDGVGMRSPVIIVTPADQDEDTVNPGQYERKIPRGAEMIPRRMDSALVDRDWREVQEFDIF